MQINQNLADETGGFEMTRQQAIEYFFNRIRKQIIVALANRKMCEDLHLMGKLELFEKDRREVLEERRVKIIV